MLVNDKDIKDRLNNPLNLMNRLNRITGSKSHAMDLFTGGRKINNTKLSFVNPFASQANDKQVQSLEPAVNSVRHTDDRQSNQISEAEILPAEEKPSIDNLVESANDRIGLALAHDESLKLLNRTISMMNMKLDDIKPEKLPAVILATSKTVESIRRERLEREKVNNGNDESIHFHFYVPKQKSLESYEIVNVTT
jgi:hypothetical protein